MYIIIYIYFYIYLYNYIYILFIIIIYYYYLLLLLFIIIYIYILLYIYIIIYIYKYYTHPCSFQPWYTTLPTYGALSGGITNESCNNFRGDVRRCGIFLVPPPELKEQLAAYGLWCLAEDPIQPSIWTSLTKKPGNGVKSNPVWRCSCENWLVLYSPSRNIILE